MNESLSDFEQIIRAFLYNQEPHTVNTYNIKEALTGIYCVQQLINVVLSERTEGFGEKTEPQQQ